MRRWMEDARTALQSFSCARVFLYIEVQGPSSPRLLAGSRPFLPAWSRILQRCIRMKNKCRMYLMVSCTCAQEELPFSFPTFETRSAVHIMHIMLCTRSWKFIFLRKGKCLQSFQQVLDGRNTLFPVKSRACFVFCQEGSLSLSLKSFTTGGIWDVMRSTWDPLVEEIKTPLGAGRTDRHLADNPTKRSPSLQSSPLSSSHGQRTFSWTLLGDTNQEVYSITGQKNKEVLPRLRFMGNRAANL